MKVNTYDPQKVNVVFGGLALTDLADSVTIEQQSDDYEVVKGVNGDIERSLIIDKMRTVTIPMMQTSPQLDVLEGLRWADKKTGAGPYPFAMTDLNGSDILIGEAWVRSPGTISKGRSTTSRSIVLDVKAELEFQGR